ncbi:MAG: hypothetical protein M1825_003747 [Sarcosagium campestre]|nr:MAG: hypothetical protein M1825_003747 [Sarcosagium campestre]
MSSPSSAWSIHTIVSDASRVVIELPDSNTQVSWWAKESTYLIDREGKTTRTLGATQRPSFHTETYTPPSVTSGGTFVLPVDITDGGGTLTASEPTAQNSADRDFSLVFGGPVTTSPSTSVGSQGVPSPSSPRQTGTPIETPTASSPDVKTTGPQPLSASVSATQANSKTPQPSSASKTGSSKLVAIGVAGGLTVLLIIFAIIYFYRRSKRRKLLRSKTPFTPPTPSSVLKKLAQWRLSNTTASTPYTQSGNDPEKSPAAPIVPTPRDIARTRLALQRWEQEQEVQDPDQAPENPIESPDAANWQRLLSEVDDEIHRLQAGTLSASEDYSTHAGEGSIDAYFPETASMRGERLYRAAREGHSPPPGPIAVMRREPSPLQLEPAPLSPVAETEPEPATATDGAEGTSSAPPAVRAKRRRSEFLGGVRDLLKRGEAPSPDGSGAKGGGNE